MGNLKKEDGLLETSVGQCLPLPVSSSVFYGRARKSLFTVTNVGPLENLEAISNVKHGLERARKSSFIVTNVRSLENKEIYPNVKRVSGPAPVNSNFVISGDNRHIDAFVKELPGPIFYSHDMVEAFESHFVSLTKIGSSSSTSSLVLNLNVKVGMQFLHFYCQKHLGDAYDLVIVRIGDTSFKQDNKAIGGIFLFLTNSSLSRAAPIFWKTKQIDRVCHSSKDAETLNILKMVDDSVSFSWSLLAKVLLTH